MVSKQWQITNRWVQYTILGVICMNLSFWFQIDMPPWQRILYLLLSFIPIGAISYVAHIWFSNCAVKVYKLGYGKLSWLVQRELRLSYVPFVKRSDEEKEIVELKLQGKGIIVKVEHFPLNLRMDDYFSPLDAAKITITPISGQRPFVQKLCTSLDQAFVSKWQ